MDLLICEGGRESGLFPLTHTRATFDLWCGARSLKSRIEAAYGVTSSFLGVRDEILAVTAESFPGSTVNQWPAGALLIINGRALWSAKLAEQIPLDGPDRVYMSGNDTVAARLSESPQAADKFSNALSLAPSSLPITTVEATVIRYPWELVRENGQQIIADAAGEPGLARDISARPNGTQLIAPERIILADDVNLGAGAVIDATGGPVIIASGAKVGHNAVIMGPVYVGADTIINPGAHILGGTTLGDACKIGGEVRQSIVLACSNKQHDGFLGHSYLGSWVNLGAGTTNSNLKNTYGSVKVPVDGEWLDSGELFVGATLGDHTMTGIGTLLNSGTAVGVGCNIFGGGMITGVVPNFSWGGADKLEPYRIDKMLEVAALAMARRQMSLSSAQEALLRRLAATTD
ncbi:MAG: hypothetical protein IIA59_01330 [Candidatus Marinimicrobia bacterium]|nr:hypothetical protein [Candidatus Neomarinimicrobiota bacterium]